MPSAAVIKSRFKAVLADRKGTLEEAEQLISLIKDGGGIENSERRQFREQYILNRDLFEGPAQRRMSKFIEEEIPGLLIDSNVIGNKAGRDLPDPAVMNEDKEVLEWSWVKGKLYVGGISYKDVVQGMIGDCYFPAALGAVAAQKPEAIRDAIKDNGDGTFTVRFYEVLWGGEKQEVKITIDGQLPLNSGGLHYAKGMNRTELWIPILEKAYAKWKGNYDAIGHGGSAGAVMEALLGRRSQYVGVHSAGNGKELWDRINSSLLEGKSLAIGTHGEDEASLYAGTGMYADHAYSVIAAIQKDGKEYVVLRNPWGEVEPSGNGPDDGIFQIDMATFQKLVNSVYIC
jgi:hypothetical protein